MALQPFAKPAELQRLAPALDDDAAALTLELVSAGIRESIGWDVDKVTAATHDRLVPYHRRASGVGIWSVILPAMNVTAVTAVVVDGVTQASTDYDFNTSSGIVYLHNEGREKVTVTYTAGYTRAPNDDAPDVFRACAVEYAVRLGGNPGGVQSWSMGGVSETYTQQVKDLADQDPRLDAYRVQA